ncbi:hypothetical protein GCM10022416_25730 [Actinomadura keratinilytica]|uniref:Uncharacterized protein n=1 Tax=Actinomadura keratinilytica TaxID=547461 RepID=A0ABP7YPR3_9ACTN
MGKARARLRGGQARVALQRLPHGLPGRYGGRRRINGWGGAGGRGREGERGGERRRAGRRGESHDDPRERGQIVRALSVKRLYSWMRWKIYRFAGSAALAALLWSPGVSPPPSEIDGKDEPDHRPSKGAVRARPRLAQGSLSLLSVVTCMRTGSGNGLEKIM